MVVECMSDNRRNPKFLITDEFYGPEESIGVPLINSYRLHWLKLYWRWIRVNYSRLAFPWRYVFVLSSFHYVIPKSSVVLFLARILVLKKRWASCRDYKDLGWSPDQCCDTIP
jgi:hypothetical protein